MKSKGAPFSPSKDSPGSNISSRFIHSVTKKSTKEAMQTLLGTWMNDSAANLTLLPPMSGLKRALFLFSDRFAPIMLKQTKP